MATEPMTTARASAATADDGAPRVLIEVGQYRVVGCFDADGWCEMTPEDARDFARNIITAARDVERRRMLASDKRE